MKKLIFFIFINLFLINYLNSYIIENKTDSILHFVAKVSENEINFVDPFNLAVRERALNPVYNKKLNVNEIFVSSDIHKFFSNNGRYVNTVKTRYLEFWIEDESKKIIIDFNLLPTEIVNSVETFYYHPLRDAELVGKTFNFIGRGIIFVIKKIEKNQFSSLLRKFGNIPQPLSMLCLNYLIEGLIIEIHHRRLKEPLIYIGEKLEMPDESEKKPSACEFEQTINTVEKVAGSCGSCIVQ